MGVVLVGVVHMGLSQNRMLYVKVKNVGLLPPKSQIPDPWATLCTAGTSMTPRAASGGHNPLIR